MRNKIDEKKREREGRRRRKTVQTTSDVKL